MARVVLASRRNAAQSGERDAFPAELNGMVATKLWDNPCWLSFRVNYIAHHFNHPIYQLIWRNHRLTQPEHVVLYALGLREGITAEDIVASSSRPKNTLSRAVNSLLRKKLIRREQNAEDRRRYHLYLSASGKAIIKDTVPRLVAREQLMAHALTPDEQATLESLMTKIILKAGDWPAEIAGEN
ncbi:MarR family winged helix-turn-helix transcriptional regulator [Terrarubrum flagellatum]|uniref:MarR family winged helix-turn-helix transcriptional regulator n=1 Tax=Terrirubrum flagellatum TaxID=2895980 RepID=UPI0031452471